MFDPIRLFVPEDKLHFITTFYFIFPFRLPLPAANNAPN